MICEVAYKVGSGGSWADGMPVEIRAAGVYVPSADFTAWIGGTEPAGISTLPIPTRQRYRNWIQRMATLTAADFNLSSVATSADQSEEDVTRMRIDAAAQVALVGEYGGLDTTWAHQELRTLSVMIADLDMQQIEGMTSVVEHLPSGELESKVLRRRAYTIPYTTLLSAGSVTDVQNTEVTVVPARGETPFAFAQLVTEIA